MHPPSVDSLARSLRADPALADLPRTMLVDAARAGIAADREHALEAATDAARAMRRSLLGPVVNATGVLLHTNLGRAPMAPASPTGSADGAVRYTNVELDLATGRRGSRRDHTAVLLRRLTGAESSLVVNNCAAAVMLVLAAHAVGRAVVVSRGELVEIGGGFRIPEVLTQSGARLLEVGTTNRTRPSDYASAIAGSPDVAMLLKVHRSNYRIEGFTEEVAIPALAALGPTVVADIGSGLLDASTPWLADASGRVPELPWLRDEPAVRQTLDEGAGIVVFSGDKLLGGPQAGIIVGDATLVDACARHPLARALRPGSDVLTALQRTLLAYADGDARRIPFWNMATLPVELLTARARSIVTALAGTPGADRCTVEASEALPGGGTLPGRTIPSAAVRVHGDLTDALRRAPVPVVARVDDGATWLDLRTVDPADDALVTDALRDALTAHPHAR